MKCPARVARLLGAAGLAAVGLTAAAAPAIAQQPPVSWREVLDAAPKQRPPLWTDAAPPFLKSRFDQIPREVLEGEPTRRIRSPDEALLVLASIWHAQHRPDLIERPDAVLRVMAEIEAVSTTSGVFHTQLLAPADAAGEAQALREWMEQASGSLQTWVQAVLREAATDAPEPQWHRLFAKYQGRAAWIRGELPLAAELLATAALLDPKDRGTALRVAALRALMGDDAAARAILEPLAAQAAADGRPPSAAARRMLALLAAEASAPTERDAMWQAQWLAQAWAPLPIQREALVRAYEAEGDASILIPLGLLEFQQGDPLRGRDLLEQVRAEGKADDTTLGYLINLLTVLPPRPSVDAKEVAKQLLAELGKLDTVAARFGSIVFPIGMGLAPAVFSAEQTAAVVQLLEDAPHEAAVHGLALLTAALADDDSLAQRIMAQPIQPRDARTGTADERAAQTLLGERAAVAVYRCIATGRDLDDTASNYLDAAAPQLGTRAALWRALAAARFKGSDAAHQTQARAELATTLAPHLGNDPYVDLWWLHARVADTAEREVFRECLAMLPKIADRTAKAAAIVQLVHCMHRNSEVPQDDLDMLEAIARTEDMEWPIRVVANLLRAEVVGGDAGAALIAATRPLVNPSHNPAHTDSFDLRRDPLVWLREVDFFMAPFVGDDGIAHLRLDLSCTFSIEYAPVPVLAGAATLYDN